MSVGRRPLPVGLQGNEAWVPLVVPSDLHHLFTSENLLLPLQADSYPSRMD